MLESTINQDIKTAMLAKEEATLRSLRAIKAALLVAKTEMEEFLGKKLEEFK